VDPALQLVEYGRGPHPIHVRIDRTLLDLLLDAGDPYLEKLSRFELKMLRKRTRSSSGCVVSSASSSTRRLNSSQLNSRLR